MFIHIQFLFICIRRHRQHLEIFSNVVYKVTFKAYSTFGCSIPIIRGYNVGGNDVLKNMLLTLMEYKFYLRDTTSPRKLEKLLEVT